MNLKLPKQKSHYYEIAIRIICFISNLSFPPTNWFYIMLDWTDFL